MPTFYSHVRDGDRLTLDPDGADLPDLDAALATGRTAVREAVSKPAAPGIDLSRRRSEITDAVGRLLATVAFRDVFGLR